MTTREDPMLTAWFGVELSGKVQGVFRECSGLGSENEVVESKATSADGKWIYKAIPGNLKFTRITLKRGITSSMDMWQWRKLVELGNIDKARVNGSIVMMNHLGAEVARWNLTNAWPSKLTGPAPNAGNNEIGVEELEIAHEGYERVK